MTQLLKWGWENIIETNFDIQCHLLELTPRVEHEMRRQQLLKVNNVCQGIFYRLNVCVQPQFIH